METFALYLFKSSVWLTAFALVYVLFLRNERFFSLNRIYLVSGILVSVIFPLFTWHYTVLLPVVPSIDILDPVVQGIVMPEESFSTQNLLLLFYLSGIGYLIFRILRQTLPVFRIIQKSETHQCHSAKLIRTDAYPASFSFFSFVFVNPSIDEIETNEIVNHELEHIRQQHWIDLLLFEILRTMQWFNPAIWLYGHLIRQNHEYLADERALQRSSNPAIYRAALLNQMFGGPVISLANSFNYSLNKKRFNMMKQTISSPFRKLKLLMVLPLIAGVFYAFAAPEYKFIQAEELATNATQNEKTIKGKVTDEKGKPLKSASVVILGKTIGTITDNNGNFVLKVTDDSPIMISYVGFETIKMKPDFGKEMMISMKTKAVQINLDEKSESSKTETLKVKSNSPLKFSSDNPASNPLIVIDGVIAKNQNTDNILPDDIESMSVLKDESATSKYGDKGKNGVVEITLKKLENTNNSDDKIFIVVEEQATFMGGNINSFRDWVTNNIKYPTVAAEKGISGKVYVQFAVNSKGEVVDVKVVHGVDPSLDKEAVRVIMSSPLWEPAKQSGTKVKQQFTIPINFQLPSTPSREPEDVFIVVEEQASFLGGDVNSFRDWVTKNIKYPTDAAKNGISGKVYVQYAVNSKGEVVDVKVVRGVDPSLDKEAVRVIMSSPLWEPAKQSGTKVKQQFTIPINFNLPANMPSRETEDVFIVVEEQATFLGGDINSFRDWVIKNIKYPTVAAKNGISGKVYVQYVVNSKGEVVDVKVVRGVDPSLDKEAVRVIMSSPLWEPGKQSGTKVKQQFTIPIDFKLPSTPSREKMVKSTVTTKTTFTKPKVDKSAQMHRLIIVPNPAKDNVTITLEGTDSHNKLDVTISDRDGQIIKKESKNGPAFSLSIANYVSGTYIIVAKDGENQFTGQLVVNH